MDKLLPCPFCGGVGIFKYKFVNGIANKKHYSVACKDCGVKTSKRKNIEKATEAWNSRLPHV